MPHFILKIALFVLFKLGWYNLFKNIILFIRMFKGQHTSGSSAVIKSVIRNIA